MIENLHTKPGPKRSPNLIGQMAAGSEGEWAMPSCMLGRRPGIKAGQGQNP